MVRVLSALALAMVVPLALLSGCGSAPPTSPPQGVDGLEIPTPSPDPRDFVDEIDNPWLPLVPGSSWTYQRVSGRMGQSDTVTVTVTDDTRDVLGVTTTVVEEYDGTQTSQRFYAQDEAGNVWLFGETGGGAGWLAGDDDAQAGIAMLATPRLGDGYRLESAGSEAQDVAEVVDLDARVDVPLGDYSGVLMTEDTSSLDSSVSARSFYVEDVGLVLQQESVSGPSLELVEFTQG